MKKTFILPSTWHHMKIERLKGQERKAACKTQEVEQACSSSVKIRDEGFDR